MSFTGHVFTDGKTVYPNGGIVEQTADLSWAMTLKAFVYAGEVDTYGYRPSAWSITRMDGQVSWHGSPNLSCSGTLSVKPGTSTQRLNRVLDISGYAPHYTVTAQVPDAIVVSSDTDPHDVQCNTDPAAGFLTSGPDQSDPNYAAWSKIISPKEDFDTQGKYPYHQSVPLTFNFSGPIPSPPNAGTVTATANATVTIDFTQS